MWPSSYLPCEGRGVLGVGRGQRGKRSHVSTPKVSQGPPPILRARGQGPPTLICPFHAASPCLQGSLRAHAYFHGAAYKRHKDVKIGARIWDLGEEEVVCPWGGSSLSDLVIFRSPSGEMNEYM